jgi:DNA-binding XRE family transcriptional regulator
MTRRKLRRWRTARDLTQRRLAELLGVATVTVVSWENDHRPIPDWLGNALIGVEAKMKAMGEMK